MTKHTPGLSRSQQMARIRATDTEPERILRQLLWAEGRRYRLHFRTPAGRADLVFVSDMVAVFVDGCFWHGCPQHYVPPRSARGFWAGKLQQNVARDQRQTAELQHAGWRVLRFWEHEVFESPQRVAEVVARTLDGGAVRRRQQPRVSRVEFLDDRGDLERRYLVNLCPVRSLGSLVRERSTAKWRRPTTG